MTLGRNVIDIMRDRAQVDREYRELCLQDTVDLLLSGETVVGLLSLHHHIYATIGFEKLGALMGLPSDDLVEMLIPPNGDPPASALFEIIGHLREDEGVDFKVAIARRDDAGARNRAAGAGAEVVGAVEVGREAVGAGNWVGRTGRVGGLLCGRRNRYLSNMMEIREYVDDRGRNAFARWESRLNQLASHRVRTALARLEAGNLSNVRSVGRGVQEYRIHYGPGYRIYFGMDGDTLIILLGGGTKQRQQRDINDARALWREYRRRKRGRRR